MSEKYLTKIIAASLLGDGGVYIPPDGSKNAHYVLRQIAEHKDYVDYMRERIEFKIGTRTQTYNPKPTDIMKNPKPTLSLITRVHPFFTKFRERMYPNGHKVVDPHYLTLIDYEFLAIWYMEDGTLVNTPNPKVSKDYIRQEVYLYSLCFSWADNKLLSKAIYEHTGLHWNVQRHHSKGNIYYKLYLARKDIPSFMEGIGPYILPSFRYKLV